MTPNTHSKYGLQASGQAQTYQEARVVNVTDEEVEFTIATTPGAAPRFYRLAPYGQDGSTIHIPDGYAREYEGAGRKPIRPIIEARTEREVYPAPLVRGPDGKEMRANVPRLPQVVHEHKAASARRAWLRALADRDQAPRDITLSVQVDPRTLKPAAAQASTAPIAKPAPLRGEVVDQDGDAHDEPPPDDDAPVIAGGPPASTPVAAAAPSSVKPGKGRG